MSNERGPHARHECKGLTVRLSRCRQEHKNERVLFVQPNKKCATGVCQMKNNFYATAEIFSWNECKVERVHWSTCFKCVTQVTSMLHHLNGKHELQHYCSVHACFWEKVEELSMHASANQNTATQLELADEIVQGNEGYVRSIVLLNGYPN